jgi:hypothetical protein
MTLARAEAEKSIRIAAGRWNKKGINNFSELVARDNPGTLLFVDSNSVSN